MKGNVTVEAACVIPFCFAVIGAVCYLGIFCYNRSVLKITAYECISQSLEKRDQDEKSFERELTRLLEEKTAERTLALENVEVSVNITSRYVTADVQAVQQMIFSQSVQTGVTCKKIYPETVLRTALAGKGKE